MKVKILKTFYDPETEKRGKAGEMVEVSEVLYRRYGKSVFKAKGILPRITKPIEKTSTMVKPVKKARKRKRRK